MTYAMVDSGASATFLSSHFVERNRVRTEPLPRPISLTNADGSKNSIGMVTRVAPIGLTVGTHQEGIRAIVADLGNEDMIIGVDWLRYHNPEIDWRAGELDLSRCRTSCGLSEPVFEQHAPRASTPKQQEACRSSVSKLRQRGLDLGGSRRVREMQAEALGLSVAELEEELEEESEVPVGFRYSKKFQEIYQDAEEFFVASDAAAAHQIAAAYTWSQAIAEKAATPEGSKSFEDMVPPQFRSFQRVFSKEASERLPERKPYDHPIDLTEGAVPPFARVYPMPPAEQKALEEYLEENLRKGYIRPSKSPAASPVFFIKKKDGTLRLIVDYRKLNALTIKNRYPLPLTTELVDQLKKAKVFTTLDLRWGYHNVRLREGDEWKAAFRTSKGLYEPTVMTFGLTNAPATFQHMMNDIFKDLIGVIVIIYLDDLLIFSENDSDHAEHVREVLRRLEANDLFCKPEKCRFFQRKVEYLGLIVSEGQIAMDPAKVEAVLNWPAPRRIKELQAFLGFANFYRRFIDGFSKRAKPMTALLRKDTPWSWGPPEQAAFDDLKTAFTQAPVLVMPDMAEQFTIECDASDFASGAILSQRQADGNLHPIAYFSKSFNDAERNYEIYDKELLAIIRALDEWRHYLEGGPYPIDIVSDHKNLSYFTENRNLTRRQARWALFLSRFDFKIRYRSGVTMAQPDALSRKGDLIPEGTDNAERTLLAPERPTMRSGRCLRRSGLS